MNRQRGIALATVLLCASTLGALAQSSASYTLEEHVLNAGGRPESGVVPGSARYSISLDSVGENLAAAMLSGNAYSLAAGFIPAYPPPGEVAGLQFLDHDRMEWDPEPSAGEYNLYRGRLRDLPALGYGDCLQSGIAGEGVADPTTPPSDAGYFYLTTATNRLAEEGSKGLDSHGQQRPDGTICP